MERSKGFVFESPVRTDAILEDSQGKNSACQKFDRRAAEREETVFGNSVQINQDRNGHSSALGESPAARSIKEQNILLMTFYSILTEGSEESAIRETPNAPDFFVDLNLDQIVDAITIGKEEYNLKPYFYTPLKAVSAITYRQEIMSDLENKQTFDHITTFARQMRFMREHLSQSSKLHYKYQKESWFLDAVEIYCNAINNLAENLSSADLKSNGLSAFRHYLGDYGGVRPVRVARCRNAKTGNPTRYRAVLCPH
jgi:hypothetical protein